MRLTRNEVIFTQLLAMDLPGKELFWAAPRVVSRVLTLAGHEPVVDPDELVSKILDLYESRSELILKTHAYNTGKDPSCILGVRATRFRGHILTHVRLDLMKMGRWEFYEDILRLPWFENFLVISPEVDVFTKDRVLDLDFIQDCKESIIKKEVDSIVYFLNGGSR